MSENMFVCDNEGCEVEFVKKTHNQRYCSDECCRLATNRRIMEKYYSRRAQRAGKVRYCKACEKTKLSRYNDSQTCSACEVAREESARKSVANMLLSVAWAS